MELQFQKTELPCLRTVLRRMQTQEQTQEVRISDGMPDIGNILGAWGQVILRGKEWESDTLTVNGGTMVWVQYMPEEGGQPQAVEGWIPFQMRWNIPTTQHDGVIMAQLMLKNVDGRSTSARKLMLRTNVMVLMHAVENGQEEIYSPENIPEDVQLRIAGYPVLLPSEAGEKAFTLEENLSMPSAGPEIARMIACNLQPEITESRIMGNKVVFRGTGMLHILYEADDGMQYSCDFDIPFSQYSELDQDYDEDAHSIIWPVVTALETDLEDDRIHVKAGIVCQYCIRHRPVIRIVEDAYSPNRNVRLQQQELKLPGILESKSQTLRVHYSGDVEGVRVANVQMLPQMITQQTQESGVTVQIPAQFQALYYDMDGQPQNHTGKWEETITVPMEQESRLETTLWPVGRLQGSMISGNLQLQGELNLQTDTVMDTGLAMVTGLELGELQPPDPNRPSLILRRAGGHTLWELAKESGATVADIQRANQLQGEPEENQMLLIPVR